MYTAVPALRATPHEKHLRNPEGKIYRSGRKLFRGGPERRRAMLEILIYRSPASFVARP